MFAILYQAMAGAIALVLGLGAAGLATATSPASHEPLRCEIRATKSGQMVSLQGVFQADMTVSGSYGFQVAGAGGGSTSRINQGGAFSANAGQEVTLGTIMLGAGSSYDASLTVKAGGKTLECAERI